MNSSNQKTHRVINNDPWAVLIALASLIIVATIAAIIVVCVLWNRYRKRRYEFEQSLQQQQHQQQQVSYQQNELQPQEYEIQVALLYILDIINKFGLTFFCY
jgi:hypothetical protein